MFIYFTVPSLTLGPISLSSMIYLPHPQQKAAPKKKKTTTKKKTAAKKK